MDQMVSAPDRYRMTAAARELTAMFCGMRGFTQRSEALGPTRLWAEVSRACRRQDGAAPEVPWLNLRRLNAKKYLYEVCSERVASLKRMPLDPAWDGTTSFESK